MRTGRDLDQEHDNRPSEGPTGLRCGECGTTLIREYIGKFGHWLRCPNCDDQTERRPVTVEDVPADLDRPLLGGM